MHYQHAYHAGNFADVFKHVLLVALLDALSRKDKPWCFTDTHAGAGLYGLSVSSTERAEEWEGGIGRVWRSTPRDALLQRYLALVGEVAGAGTRPTRYPGSPWLAARVARPGDRVVACETVPEVASVLRCAVPRAGVQQCDGYGVRGALPPRERRGLVLVDPPFERADEFDAARAFITAAVPRYAGGVFALWYPLKNRHAADHALRCLARDAGRPVLDLRLDVGSSGDGKMHACGLAVLGAPYRFAETVRPALAELVTAFGPRANFSCEPVAAP